MMSKVIYFSFSSKWFNWLMLVALSPIRTPKNMHSFIYSSSHPFIQLFIHPAIHSSDGSRSRLSAGTGEVTVL